MRLDVQTVPLADVDRCDGRRSKPPPDKTPCVVTSLPFAGIGQNQDGNFFGTYPYF